MKIAIIVFSSLFSFGLLSQSNWDFEKKDGNIKAYSRIKKDKDFYEFRTVFTVKTDIEEAKKLIFAVDKFKHWMPSTIDSKLLKSVDDNNKYAYTLIQTPWPASNRDLVFKVTKQEKNTKNVIFIMEGKSNYLPENSGIVRVQEYTAKWDIKQLSNDEIEVIYTASFNPGSTYPTWLIKNHMIDARIQTSKNFIKVLER